MILNASKKCVFLAMLVSCLILNFACDAPKKNPHAGHILFDDEWRFIKKDQENAQARYFDDSDWRLLDLPHDWSIEDLPPMPEKIRQSLAITKGEWKFKKGDNSLYKETNFDDSQWQKVKLPLSWEEHSKYTEENAYGWYRRKIEIPDELKGKEIDLYVGIIDDVDETFVNGVKIGQTGLFPPNYDSKADSERIYKIPTNLLKGDGADLVAVRVYDQAGRGGIYNSITPEFVSGPFYSKAIGNRDVAYTVGGIGWYRKKFNAPVQWQKKRIVIRFDGVYMNSDVWINGVYLGNHPYGYTSFSYDITKHLKFGSDDNVIAVKVKNIGDNSRWYSGSGIYRHVELLVNEPVHIDHRGTFVTTKNVTPDAATVNVDTKIANHKLTRQKVTLNAKILDAEGKDLGNASKTLFVDSNSNNTATLTLSLKKPALWSPDSPSLYILKSVLQADGKVLDTTYTTFGIRSIEFTSDKGFMINGKPTLLKGGCMHHDNGPLGAAAYDFAEYRRVRIMKQNGFNAIRCAHNPPSVAFLNACDELGVFVIDEAFDVWNNGKKPDDYHRYFKQCWKDDIKSMILRDRNHPSIIMWSTGNEIQERQSTLGFETSKMLADYVRTLDTSRPVTNALNGVNPEKDPFMQPLDVVGYNYAFKWNDGHRYEVNAYVDDHQRKPERVIYGSEAFPLRAFDYWMAALDYPWVIGDFVWTAYDYLGEAGIGWYGFSGRHLWTLAYCGDIDITGKKRPQSYYRDAFWGTKPTVSAFVKSPQPSFGFRSGWDWTFQDVWPSWNWPQQKGRNLNVEIYSNCQEIELFINQKSCGKKQISRKTKFIARFNVPYQPGILKAVAYNDAKQVADWTLVTAGAPAKIALKPELKSINAQRRDLCYVNVEITDQNDNLVPDAENIVNFSIDGPADIIAVANSDPANFDSLQSPTKKAFKGRIQVIIKPHRNTTGKVKLSADSKGLAAGTVEITVN